jgi:hypothetical protein
MEGKVPPPNFFYLRLYIYVYSFWLPILREAIKKIHKYCLNEYWRSVKTEKKKKVHLWYLE